ncbi:hypothetical protein [Sulfurospirillum sp. MES]|uniref:hypothetical protein n=1 Tax=Sulfurospirillum sp. MES TaxID=1565314 RepID=UPI000541D3E5|nr:hypothetical protein [Sulfurospirillum sp. MES]KHG32983.1 MAG: hypothetical protein OA34_12350 [Sulfurospirillum sp. MES]
MLIPGYLVDVYQSVLNQCDAEMIVYDDRVEIDSADGRLTIDSDGFIDHRDFKASQYEREIINCALLVSNKISSYERISKHELYHF